MGMRITIYARALASALTVAATFAASAYVVSGGEGYPWTYAEQSDGTIVLGGNGNSAATSDISGAVVIPSSIKGKAVTAIGKYAFRNCRNIRTVEIPDSVKRIEEGAFFECTPMPRRAPGRTYRHRRHGIFRMLGPCGRPRFRNRQ